MKLLDVVEPQDFPCGSHKNGTWRETNQEYSSHDRLFILSRVDSCSINFLLVDLNINGGRNALAIR
jgi:hypothetical protein